MVVTLRVSNRGRGRSQAEPDAYVYLRDDEGREIQASTAPATGASLGESVPAGDSRLVQVVFDHVSNARAVAGYQAFSQRDIRGRVFENDGAWSRFHMSKVEQSTQRDHDLRHHRAAWAAHRNGFHRAALQVGGLKVILRRLD